jgi:hypothetical protein
MKTYEEHFEACCALRDKLWQSIGTVDPYVLAPALNPAFMGGPRWPSLRQAFTTIQTPDATIIASDGLSDPYDDMDTNPKNAGYNGLGLEVYLVAEKLAGGKVPGSLELTLEAVRMVNVKLLTLKELAYIMEHGEKGRNKVAELLIKQGNASLSTLERASVI